MLCSELLSGAYPGIIFQLLQLNDCLTCVSVPACVCLITRVEEITGEDFSLAMVRSVDHIQGYLKLDTSRIQFLANAINLS